MADVPPLGEQEAEGLFHEEIQKLVDGVVEDIRNGHVPTQDAAVTQLHAAIPHSRYATDEVHMLEVIKYRGRSYESIEAYLSANLRLISLVLLRKMARTELLKRTECEGLPP